jgi:hypothetical protein
VTDLLRVGVVGMGGKKMCQLHREVWDCLFRSSEVREVTNSWQ